MACSKRESDSSYLRNDSWAQTFHRLFSLAFSWHLKRWVVGRQINSVEGNNIKKQREKKWENMCNNVKIKKNQRRIQEFLLGGSKLWFRKDCWTFLRQITSHRDPHVVSSHSVNAGRSPLAREILLREQRRRDHRRVSVVNCNNVVSCNADVVNCNNSCRKL